jgi:hypothetical protein
MYNMDTREVSSVYRSLWVQRDLDSSPEAVNGISVRMILTVGDPDAVFARAEGSRNNMCVRGSLGVRHRGVEELSDHREQPIGLATSPMCVVLGKIARRERGRAWKSPGTPPPNDLNISTTCSDARCRCHRSRSA